MSQASGSADPIEFLPHRPPFRFVSRVVVLQSDHCEAIWSVRGDESFFEGHFPGQPIVPGVLLGEALAQAAGLVAAKGGAVVRGRLAHVDLRFKAVVVPPAEIGLSVRLERVLGTLRQFEAVAQCLGKTAAVGSLTLAIEA